MKPVFLFIKKINLGKIFRVLNPFGTERLVLTYAGNPKNKKQQILVFLRMYHISLCLTIPLGIITLFIILPRNGYIPHSNFDIGIITIIFYLFSLILILTGYKWNQIFFWVNQHTNIFNHFTFNDGFREIYVSHMYRIGNFFIITLLGFWLGLGNASWFAIIPLFAISGLALILVYPTNKRISKWEKDFQIVNSG